MCTPIFRAIRLITNGKNAFRCKKALAYIGLCYSEIVKNRKNFTSLKSWYTDYKGGKTNFQPHHMAVDIEPNMSDQKRFEIACAESNLRYLQIKAEFVTYCYFYALENNLPELEHLTRALQIAVDNAKVHEGSAAEKMFRYIWDLSWVYYMFGNMRGENTDWLPLYQKLISPRIFSYIGEFGSHHATAYNPRVQCTPRSSTNVPIQEGIDTLFYIPHQSPVQDDCDYCMTMVIDQLPNIKTISEILIELRKSLLYEQKYLVAKKEDIKSDTYKMFENDKEALNFVEETKRTETLPPNTVFMLMIKTGVKPDGKPLGELKCYN